MVSSALISKELQIFCRNTVTCGFAFIKESCVRFDRFFCTFQGNLKGHRLGCPEFKQSFSSSLHNLILLALPFFLHQTMYVFWYFKLISN